MSGRPNANEAAYRTFIDKEFMVASDGDGLVINMPSPRRVSKQRALVMAASIVALADESEHCKDFVGLVAAVRADQKLAGDVVDTDVHTDNEFLVGVHGDRIAVQIPVVGELSNRRALVLAAWLVTCADAVTGADDGTHGEFNKILAALES